MEEMRCLMFGRVTESVWYGLMLKTMGTMSRSSHSRVQRFGAYHVWGDQIVHSAQGQQN